MINVRNIRNRWLILLLLCPLTWQILAHPTFLFNEWSKSPQKLSSFHPVSESYNRELIQLRWGDQSLHREAIYHKLIYSKLNLIANEFFEYTQYFALPLYYLTGDGTKLSYPGLSPIPLLYLPLTLVGVRHLLKKRQYRLICIFFLTAIPAYIIRERNFVYLIVTAGLLVYVSSIGWHVLKKYDKHIITVLATISIHNILIWLNII